MKTLLIILLNFILIANAFGAAFDDIGSVRARGMGDAFESIEGGIDSIYYNPAGTAYQKSLQVLTEYAKPAVYFDDDSSFNHLHFGVSVPFSTKPYLVFLNYLFKGLTIGNEQYIMRDGSFSFLFHTFFVSDFYHERLFTFNIGKSLNNLLEGANIAVGANFKIYNAGYEINDDIALHPLSPTESTTGFGVDFGLTYDFSKYIRISFVLDNIIQPNISYFKESDDGKELLDSGLKGGLAWRFGDILFFQDLVSTLGLQQISKEAIEGLPPRPSETIYKAGVEFWQWHKRIGFRMGLKTDYPETTLMNFSTGISYKHKFMNQHTVVFHYAFNYPMKSENVKNFWSLNYEFDFADYFFDYRTDSEIEGQTEIIKENFTNKMVLVKYKTLPNDNLYNISLIHYGTPSETDLLMKQNKIEDEKAELPEFMEVPYNAASFILYEIKPGDTMQRVSLRVYGDPNKIEKILRFNKIPFSKLRVKRILIIPMSTEERQEYDRNKADWESSAEQALNEQTQEEEPPETPESDSNTESKPTE